MTDNITPTHADLYALIGQGMQALGPHYQQVVTRTFEEHAMTGRDWYIATLALGCATEPLTPAYIHYLMPYNHADHNQTRLVEAAEHGFLQAADPDVFRLTEKGRRAVQAFFTKAQAALAEVPVEGADTDRLAALLGRVIAGVEGNPEPAAKRFFVNSRQTDTGDLAPIPRIDQYLTDLSRFRDDAHIAAWQPYDVEGIVWEAFSFIWGDQFADFPERLAARGYPAEALDRITTDLVKRGWAQPDGEALKLTDEGAALRAQAEAETDRLYFVGWDALSDTEVTELAELLRALIAELTALAPTPEGATDA